MLKYLCSGDILHGLFYHKQNILISSFDLDEKEKAKIERFLLFLEKSNVGDIIYRYIKNTSSKGGRPNCNYFRLFATNLYGFAFDKYTLREIESACKYDLRYITLMEQARIDYLTISKFINTIIVPNQQKIFSLLCSQIKVELNLVFEDAGYGILKNYQYINVHHIENYIKYQTWEGNISDNFLDVYYLNEDNTITCLNDNIGYEVVIENRHPKKANAFFYKIVGCNNCSFKSYCKRFMKKQDKDFKIFEVIKEF